jgi:predicted nuclease of predicted toxin-antitoxin system
LSDLRFYFDESVELVVSQQIAASGIDTVSAHSLGKLSDKDIDHLRRSTEMGRVLCTYDKDFLRLAVEFPDHSGIVFAQSNRMSIGGWLRLLRALHSQKQAEDIAGQVVFLSGS